MADRSTPPPSAFSSGVVTFGETATHGNWAHPTSRYGMHVSPSGLTSSSHFGGTLHTEYKHLVNVPYSGNVQILSDHKLIIPITYS